MNCRICGSASKRAFSATILQKYNIQYFHCDTCGFLQTEEPHWLSEAYQHPINASDCGLLARNIRFARLTAPLLYFAFDRHGHYLDYAGGYGVFTRLMRDIGFDYYWQDPHTKNVFAEGFEFNNHVGPIELVTAFEAFEHFTDPAAELDKMFAISKNLLFSTLLLPEPVPKPDDWWYYGTDHGQHIALYSSKTLRYLAQQHGTYLLSNGVDIHLFTTKQISPFFFRYLHQFSKYGLLAFVHRRMVSLTVRDRDTIAAKLNAHSPNAGGINVA